MIDYDAAEPPYRQVARIIARRIETGDLAPGARVPSITTIAQEYGIAKNTARRALTTLAEQGLVRIVPGWGTFVTERG